MGHIHTEVLFTPKRLASFKRAYNKAVRDSKDQFTWDGNDYVTNYAKYVLEYVGGRVK